MKEILEVITQAMKFYTNQADIQFNACCALGNIAYHNEDYAEEINSMGGIEIILHAMTVHTNHAEVQRYACHALGNLSSNHKLRQEKIVSLGGMEVVLLSLQMREQSVIQCALWALINFTEDCDGNIRLINNNPKVREIIETLKRDARDNRELLEDIYSLDSIINETTQRILK